MEAMTIKDLALSAADGAAAGIQAITDAGLAVELEEFTISITYAAETSFDSTTTFSASATGAFKILPIKASVGHTRSSRVKATYGLTVAFTFRGKDTDASTG